MSQVWCLVVAAGTGARFGQGQSRTSKQFTPFLDFDSVLEATLAKLLKVKAIKGICLVVSDEYQLHQASIESLFDQANMQYCYAEGGVDRTASVVSGLQALENKLSKDDFVMVHDAARPCVQVSDIENLLKLIEQNDQASKVGALLACPVRDTLKRQSANRLKIGQVDATLDREGIWQAFTPQVFPFGLLLKAFEKAGFFEGITDEASVVERIGLSPLLLKSSITNIKITYPEDLEIAEKLY